MFNINLQLFGGRGASSGTGGAKVSPSGILPQRIRASSEKQVVQKFNSANSSKTGNGYKIMGYKASKGGYEIAQTVGGKPLPKSAAPRIYADIMKNSDGTYRFV